MFSASGTVAAGLPEANQKFSCVKEIENTLTQIGSKNFWILQAPNHAGTSYRTPTDIFGRWIELSILNQGGYRIYSVTNSSLDIYDFGGDCKVKKIVEKGMDFSQINKSRKKFMTDVELKKVLEKEKTGIIYIWSPGMVYSVEYV